MIVGSHLELELGCYVAIGHSYVLDDHEMDHNLCWIIKVEDICGYNRHIPLDLHGDRYVDHIDRAQLKIK
jgi:hypothetical protein